MDARHWLETSRRDLEQRFDALRAGAPVLDDLLRRLEQRWSAEEHWLFPTLHEAWQGDRGPYGAHLDDLVPLRELTARVRGTPEPALLAVLEGVATLHLEGVARLVEGAPAATDWERLGADFTALQRRWDAEVAATGDIEDEDADPVGRPPR